MTRSVGHALLLAVAAAAAPQPVTIDNFLLAESDNYMSKYVEKGALGKFDHARTVTPVDTSPGSAPTHGQDVIRMNRDTLYSFLMLDLSSDAVVTYPENAGRFISFMCSSETHDVFPGIYKPGKYLITKDGCGCTPPCRSVVDGQSCSAFGTAKGFILLRMLAVAGNDTDVKAANALQDRFTVEQKDVGRWDVPDWDQDQLSDVRESLLHLQATSKEPPVFGFFTGPDRIDHLYGIMMVAAGWGGARAQDQTYAQWLSQDSTETHSLTMPKVPLEDNGFWSVTVYSREGFMFADPSNYNSAAQGAGGLNPDGSTTVHFGGCDDPARQKPSAAHCLPIQKGWNIAIRFFRPSKEILDGSWKPSLPEPDGACQGSACQVFV